MNGGADAMGNPLIRRVRTLALVLLLSVSAVLAVWTGTRAVADLLANPARRVMADWTNEKHPRAPDDARWRQAVASLQAGDRLAPGNPVRLLELGRLHHRRALEHPLWSPTAKKRLQQAIGYYQSAAARSPSWGLLWLNLAQAQVQAGYPARSALANLKRAMLLDPWNPNLQRNAIRLGFILWPGLNPNERHGILSFVKKGLKMQPYRIIELAVRLRHGGTIRPLLHDNPKWIHFLGQLQQRFHPKSSKTRIR